MDLKSVYFPEATISRRLRMLKNLLALAVLSSVAISWRLWAGQRMFPMVPVIDGLPQLNEISEKIIFAVFMLLPIFILIGRRPKFCIIAFLLLSVFLVLYDQSRIQPWFYQYFVMFFLLAFYNWRVDEPKLYTPIFNTIKICIVFLYIWSGIHKLNVSFFHETWPWMLSPASHLFSGSQMNFLEKAGYVLPFLEIFGGLALLRPTIKRIAIPILISTHILMLILTGPLGNNYNPVLWPWNFFMIFFIYFLFAGKTENTFNTFQSNLSFKPGIPAILLVGILPAFNLVNKWDSFLSSNFYPRSTSSATIELSDEAVKKLPGYLAAFTKKENGKQVLNIDSWALDELNAPNYPEKRVYEVIASEVKKITCCNENGPQNLMDVNLRFKEKTNIFASK